MDIIELVVLVEEELPEKLLVVTVKVWVVLITKSVEPIATPVTSMIAATPTVKSNPRWLLLIFESH